MGPHMRLVLLTVATLALALPTPTMTTRPAPPRTVLRIATFANIDTTTHPIYQSILRHTAATNTSAVISRYAVPTTERYTPWLDGLTAPDLIPTPAIVYVRTADAFYDLSALFASSGLDSDLIPAAAARVYADDASPRAVPLEFAPTGCFYSRSLFSSLSLSPPTTWDALLDVCAVVDASGRSCLGVGAPYIAPTVYADYLLLRAHGADFYAQFLAGNVSLTTDARVNASLAALATLVPYFRTTDVPSRFPSITPVPTPRLFDAGDLSTGAVAITCDFVALAPHLSLPSFVGPDDLGLFVFPDLPAPPSALPGEIGSIITLAIPNNALYPAEALALLAHLVSPAESAAIAADGPYSFPVRASLNVSTASPLIAPIAAALKSASDLLGHSASLAGSETVSLPWIAAITSALNAPTAAAATALLAAALPPIEAARVAAVHSAAAAPVFSPPPGAYPGAVRVTLSTPTPNAAIFYTTDGSLPSTLSPVYTNPIHVASSLTIRAFAMADSLASSPSTHAAYTVAPRTPPPRPSPPFLLVAVVTAVATIALVVAAAAVFVVRRRNASVVHRLATDTALVVPASELDLGACVGAGSFGTVYAGEWRGTPVAVKCLRALKAEAETPELASFVSEAALLLSLRHPSVLLFMGVTTKPLAIVTEFMDRGSLYATLHNPALAIPPSIAAKWAYEMASGLAFLARANVVHGDFKSANVLFDANWHSKISDFGLASLTPPPLPPPRSPLSPPPSPSRPTPPSSSSSVAPAPPPAPPPLASSLHAIGSLFWAAPELLTGTSPPTHNSDAYALAITLWELATRADPYAATPPIAAALQVVAGSRPPLADVPAPLAATLTPVISALWIQSPSSRMSLAAAAAHLASSYSIADLTFPAPATPTPPPSATPIVVFALLAGYSTRLTDLSPPPHGACEPATLVAFHDALAGAAADSLGSLVHADVGRLTLAFPTHATAAAFAAFLTASHWAACVAAVAVHAPFAPAPPPTPAARPSGPAIAAAAALWPRVFGHASALETGLPIPPPRPAPSLPTPQPSAGLYADSFLAAALVAAASPTAAASSAPLTTFPLASDTSLVALIPSVRSPRSPSTPIAPSPPPLAPRLPILTHRILAHILASADSDAPLSGRFGSILDAEWDGTPVTVCVLHKQDLTLAELGSVATTASLSATAAAACPPHTALAPLALCLDLPHVALVFPATTAVPLAALLHTPHPPLVLTPLSAATVVRDLTAALAAVHAATGRGHGAITPASVLVRLSASTPPTAAGAVLTHICLDSLMTNQGSMTTLPPTAYLSPEDLAGATGSCPGDVFSTATIIYELATGAPAFASHTPFATANAIRIGSRPSLDALSPDLAAIIAACWLQDPSARPTMPDLAARLTNIDRLE